MLRSMRRMASIGLLMATIVLAGCPTNPDPVLSVTPLALNFGANENSKTLRIQNRGGGTLTWTATISEGAPWLTMEVVSGTKQAQMVEGESTDEIDTIALNLDSEVLAQSTARTATVVVSSNAGSQTVNVSVTALSPGTIAISPTSLAFGDSGSTMDVTISNDGAQSASYAIDIPEDAPWLSSSLASNPELQGGGADAVTFSVDRTGLQAGNFSTTVQVTSGDPNVVLGTIVVTMTVPPLIVSTGLLDFGPLTEPATQPLRIRNPSDAAVALVIESSVDGGGAPWFVFTNPPVTSLGGLASVSLGVSASPVGLPPGEYTGTITVTAPGADEDVPDFVTTVAVRMEVPGFSISPESIGFGEITQEVQGSFVIENLLSEALAYRITVPAGNPWLSVSSPSGELPARGLRTIQVDADPSTVAPGNYSAELLVEFGEEGSGLEGTVAVTMSRPQPAQLEASPKNIFFGTGLIEQRIAIWNIGIGTINWRIASAGFPGWLSLSPTDGSGVASGSVTGDETDEVTLRVDRSMAPPDTFELEHSFTITASGDATNTITINLTAAIPLTPDFVLEADAVDDRGIATLAVAAGVESRTFIIRNEGTGTLDWSFGELPSWIASLSPSQGSLEPNVQQTVTLTVDREGLVTPGVQEFLEISTNDPNNERVLLDVAVSVPPVIIIGTDRSALGFQDDESARLLSIANFGDPGTILNYQVVSNQEWLSISPATGTSEGTISAIKDFQEHSVTVDRSRLDGEGASGRLIISAFLIEDGVAVPDPSIAPVEVPITVEAAPLTIESAMPRKRVPSLVRNLLMLRNIRSEVIPIPISRLESVGDAFRIAENEVPLELSETNQFLKRDYSANVLILLDFSGSMLESAQAVLDDGQLGDPALLAEDPLKTIYLQTISQMIAEMPAHYRVGLGIFNDHAIPEQGVVRTINPSDGEPAFTSDKAVLQARLASISVRDNGATDLLPAVEEGSNILLAQDSNDNLRPFDDADMKALVVVTDGRDTSLSRVTETANLIFNQGVRLFMIGWGQQVQADPIIRLTTTTGGHYYSTSARATGQQDPFGVPIRIPLVSELEDWTHLDAGDECDQSLANDLDSQVLLSYTTLNEEPSVVVRLDLTFNDPNDQNSECLVEQGQISGGTEYRQQDFFSISGDNRAGQISLRTEGISGNEATVYVRADYIPRNITRLSFNITLTSLESPSLVITRVPQTEGGLISDWDVGGAAPTYTYSSPDGEPIRFSDFGDLLEIRVTNITQAFFLNFEVTDPIYDAGNFETKYVTHPDSILVNSEPFLATSFPAPFFDSRPAPTVTDSSFTIFVDDAIDQVEIDVFNLGGSHVPPGAVPDPITGEFDPEGIVNIGLFWEAAIGASSNFLTFEENTQQTGFVTSTDTPSTVFVNLDRSALPPGNRRGEVLFTYGSGSVNVSGSLDPVVIRYQVQVPEFLISEPFINFGFTPDSQEVGITNVGQSTLQWEVDTSAFPSWLELSSVAGASGPDETTFTTINIIRENLPEGEQEHTIVFNADFANPATLTVAAEGLPIPP